MDELEKRADALLRSPLGCAFLLAISEAELPLEAIADPQTSLRLAAECADYIDPHSGENDSVVLPVLDDYGRSRRLWPESPGLGSCDFGSS